MRNIVWNNWIAISLLLCSCNFNNTQKYYITINSDVLNIDTLKCHESIEVKEIVRITNIRVVGDYIVAIAGSMVGTKGSKKVFNLYSKNNMEYLGSYVNYGRTRDEIIDINPNYFYMINDSTFSVNVNKNLKENVYKISNDEIILESSNNVVNEVPGNIYRVKDSYIVLNSENKDISSSEYVIITPKNREYTREYRGIYPFLNRGNLEEWQYDFVYNKYIKETSDGFLSIYFAFPLIRKYDNDFNIIGNYIFDDIEKYIIEDFNDFRDRDLTYFWWLKSYNDVTMLLTSKQEFIVINDNCDILKRIYIDLDYEKVIDIHFDSNCIFILKSINDTYIMDKIYYSV